MSSPRRRVSFLLALLLLFGGSVAVWYFFFRVRENADESFAANIRGVGHMERYEYDDAAKAFRDAVAKHPKARAPRLNLAIALLNANPDDLSEPEQILKRLLAEFPDDPHAHYTLGILLKHTNRLQEAYPHFDAVLKVDPNDAYSWLHKGICHPKGEDSEEAIVCFKKTLELDPNLNVARHKLFTLARDMKSRRALLEEFERYKNANWDRIYKIRYSDMGPYAEVIGRTKETFPPQPVGPLPLFTAWDALTIKLASGARWATPADWGAGPVGEVLRQVRERFGATLVLFDYNRDQRPDIFMLGAVVEAGNVRDLLLRNDGNGVFTDVTKDAGLAGFNASIGCAVADYDNDEFRDLVITGVGTQRLLRNTGRNTFEDMSATVGLDKIGGVCLGAGWLDVDQDSDLDLFLARVADTPEGALQALQGQVVPGGRAVVFLNAGNAPPVPEGQKHPPLASKFLHTTELKELLVQGPVTTLLAADFDHDRDADLLFLVDGQAPHGVRNDRLLRFGSLPNFPGGTAQWNGGLVLDVNHDGHADVLLLPHGKTPVLLLSNEGHLGATPETWFTTGITNAPPLKHASVVDIDADGWADVVGLGQNGHVVLLHNSGDNKLVQHQTAFPNLPTDCRAVTAAHVDDDCTADLVVWSAKDGLQIYRGSDNGNKTLQLELSGRYEIDSTRTNLDGIGVKVEALAGRLWTTQENTTLNAGLGQTRLPVRLGLGRAASADVLRLLWPDGTPQAEVNVAACGLLAYHEQNRKPTSCPVLMLWDGTKYAFLTDCLGGGALGESSSDGSVRPPRPEESIKIEPGVWQPKNGKLMLKIAEPMDELTYLDRVQLFAIDHPKDRRVYPDERFATSGAPPTQNLLVFRDVVFPTKAIDHHGHDVTVVLRDRDQKYLTDFAKSTWLGYAEDHYVELDFAAQLAKLPAKQKVYLVCAGWTDYAYPETINAATQAGVPTNAPMLERQQPDGSWKPVVELGFPAGMPRVMTMDVTGLLEGPTCKVRVRTNLQVYWDQIYVGVVEEIATLDNKGTATVTTLEVASATLAARGFIAETRPHGKRGPIVYDDSRTEIVPVTPWKGRLTKLGTVTPLLLKEDDQFVLCGPGDEITISFDATKLPPLAEGYVRSYVLKTWGYCKDTSMTTASGGSVEPLPFRGMKTFPNFDATDRQRSAELHDAYRKQWNTRLAPGGE